MLRTPTVLAGAALIAAAAAVVLAGAAPRADEEDERRYAIAILAAADAGGGAFVSDTASGETMFCTPRDCRRLAVRAAAPAAPVAPAAPAAPQPMTVDEILRSAPPEAVPPPVSGTGNVNPALRDF